MLDLLSLEKNNLLVTNFHRQINIEATTISDEITSINADLANMFIIDSVLVENATVPANSIVALQPVITPRSGYQLFCTCGFMVSNQAVVPNTVRLSTNIANAIQINLKNITAAETTATARVYYMLKKI